MTESQLMNKPGVIDLCGAKQPGSI